MKAIFITARPGGAPEIEVWDDVAGLDFAAYAAALVQDAPGRCSGYIVTDSGMLALAAREVSSVGIGV